MKLTKIIVLLFIFTFSCKPTEVSKEISCPTYKILDENQISWSTFAFKGDESKSLNQLSFCTHHPNIVAEIIFEDYGKWNKIYYETKNNNPMLLWEDIFLEKIGIKVDVSTSSYNDRYSSIIIFDNNGKDLLTDNSEYKTILVDYFVEKINSYEKLKQSKFMEEYWKEVNPKMYEYYYGKKN